MLRNLSLHLLLMVSIHPSAAEATRATAFRKVSWIAKNIDAEPGHDDAGAPRTFAQGRRPSLFGKTTAHQSRTALKLRGGFSMRDSSANSPSVAAPSAAGGAIRVAFQGEPGAYSEKSTRELLGSQVTAVGHKCFEECFRAVSNMECDYACLPVENSLGGSIHENYDLLLRYDLTIVAEHEFRVEHCLLAQPGVKLEDIRYAVSHPQALAQCDNYLRELGIMPVPMYDTAGSAKMIAEGDESRLPGDCTPKNTAAIASDLAGKAYGMNCLREGIEDDDSNFTRFLLLGRKGVTDHLTSEVPTKTSIVFTLPDSLASGDAGSLYKAMAAFAMRDIGLSKIESRPTSASLLNYLRFQSQTQQSELLCSMSTDGSGDEEKPRFRYCFYLDFLANPRDEATQNALKHLGEQAGFLRVLGSYPQKSQLVGPVAAQVEAMNKNAAAAGITKELSQTAEPAKATGPGRLKVGVIGFDELGQTLAKRFSKDHTVAVLDKSDKTSEANGLGVDFFQDYQMPEFLKDLDVVVLAVPLTDFEETVQSLPRELLQGKLIVETSPLKSHPKSVLLREFGETPDIDILSSNPMIGKQQSSSAKSISSWAGRAMIYEKVRISDAARCQQFLATFEECKLSEMSAEQHDETVANAEFLARLTSQLLTTSSAPLLRPTPIASPEFKALRNVAAMDGGFDAFFDMFRYHDNAQSQMNALRENLSALDRQLAAKEAYLQAQKDLQSNDRQRLLAETKQLFEEIVTQQAKEEPINAGGAKDELLSKSNQAEELIAPILEEELHRAPNKAHKQKVKQQMGP